MTTKPVALSVPPLTVVELLKGDGKIIYGARSARFYPPRGVWLIEEKRSFRPIRLVDQAENEAEVAAALFYQD